MDTHDLSGFQTAFAEALMGRSPLSDPMVARLADQPAFAIYRNGFMKSSIDALQANYPAVVRVVGEEWFRAAAGAFVLESPPSTPMLVTYGGGFADFLAAFAPAAELPYLPDVARLDRCWTEAHVAANEPILDGAILATMDPRALGDTVLVPHAAAHWRWFDEMPIYSLWHRNRSGTDLEADLDWRGEGALIARPGSVVDWYELAFAECAFLDACRAGEPLAVAAQAALNAQAEVDLSNLIATLLTRGAFSTAHPLSTRTE